MQKSKQAKVQLCQYATQREDGKKRSHAAPSLSISTSACHFCHLKAFLLNEVKSIFNKIKDIVENAIKE